MLTFLRQHSRFVLNVIKFSCNVRERWLVGLSCSFKHQPIKVIGHKLLVNISKLFLNLWWIFTI